MAVNIQLRRDTSATWASVNPTLMEGEFGLERDTKKLKVGDGATPWNSLPYVLNADMLKSVYDSNNDGTVDSADYAATAPWDGITNKPSTYPPSVHGHDASEVTGIAPVAREAVGGVSYDMTGFPNQTDSTISFNEATRTFTLSPVGASFTVWRYGVELTITTSKTLTIANTDGGHYIAMDASGNLFDAGINGDIRNNVLVGYIYWDAANGKAIIVGEERHSSHRNLEWHFAQHRNFGAMWRSGGTMSYTLSNDSAVNLSFATPMVIADEDMEHTIVHSASPANFFEQVLSGSASLTVLYLSGTTYVEAAPSTQPFIAGTTTARYNQLNGATWQLTDAGEGKYVTYWVVATNDIRRPIKMVLGRVAHSTLDAAYGEAYDALGLPLAENVPMYQIVVHTSTAFTGNSARVQIAGVRLVTDRSTVTLDAFSATNHNSLSGRSDADQHPISAVTGLQTALDGKEASISKALGYAKWTAGGWSFVNETYLTVEDDPVFLASPASGISNTMIGNWNTAFGWGNHASAGYQAALVSGTNIKTVNGSSLLGAGNLAVSATPAGNTGDVQYNNGGAFAAAANVSVDGGDLLLTANAAPTVPPTGHVKVFGKSVASRVMAAIVGPSNMDAILQPSMWRQKIASWNPPGNATTVPGVNGFGAFTALGNVTARTVATTNLMARTRRLGYVASNAVGSLCGAYATVAQFTTGDGAGLGGFFFSNRFAFSDSTAAVGAGQRAFMGLSSTVAAPTNVEASTLTNSIGVAQLSTDSTQLYLVYGGSAAQAAIALGTNFPPMTAVGTTNGPLYELTLYAPPSANGVVYYRLERVGTAFVAEGTLTPTVVGTQTPASTTLMGPRFWRTNNATSGVVAIDMVNVYLETDY